MRKDYHILFIEDNKIEQQIFLQYMNYQKVPYKFTVAGSVKEAKEKIENSLFDVVISDYYLGDGIALDIFDLIKNVPIIVITGAGDEETAINAAKAGAYDYFVKTSNKNHLKLLPLTIDKAIEKSESEHKIKILSSALMSIYDSVVLMDVNRNVFYVNNSFQRMFGYKSTEIVDSSLDIIWKKDELDKFKDLISSEGNKTEGEFQNIRKDGSSLSVSISVSTIQDRLKNIVAIVCIIRDITESVKSREKLQNYSEGLELLVEDRTKKLEEARKFATIGETASMVGHDLRNPLQVIVNTLYLTRMKLNPEYAHKLKKPLNDEITGSLAKIDEQVEYMNKIVSDLQDYSKNITLDFRKTDFKKLISETINSLVVPSNIEIEIKNFSDLPEFVIDPGSMKRIMTNLISNSIQAMIDGGKITISGDIDEKFYFLSLTDQGGGIPQKFLSKLFTPLQTSKAKGLGLGLAVCKKFVDAHKGYINISNTESGIAVSIKIPIRKDNS